MNPADTARCTSWQVAPGRIAAGARSKYSTYASAIRSVSAESVASRAAIARETSTQCIPGPATSSEGSMNPPRISLRRAILNSGRANASVPVRTMFMVSRPQPSARNHSSAAAMTSAAVLPGAYASKKISNPRSLMRTESRTDSSSASLLTARARSNSTSKRIGSRPASAW